MLSPSDPNMTSPTRSPVRSAGTPSAVGGDVINTGDTAWVLASAALVLLMTPGLAFFYGGMVRSKSVLNMMMMSFSSLAIITVLWVLYGYSEAFGDDLGGGLVGDPTQFAGLKGLIGSGE